MFSIEKHINNLVRHINFVQEATLMLGNMLIMENRQEFGRILIGNGFIHDASKFSGVEWEYLHRGNNIPPAMLEVAIHNHNSTNPHHPEFWGGIINMPEIYVAEMVCDWYARSQEFGTGLRDWIKDIAIERFKIDINSNQNQWIDKYVDMLLQNTFPAAIGCRQSISTDILWEY